MKQKLSFISGLLSILLVLNPFASSAMASSEGLESAEENVTEVVYENVTEEVYENVTEVVYENVTEEVYENVTEEVYENVTEEVYENVTEEVYENVTEEVYENVTEEVYENVTDEVYESVTEEVYDNVTGDVYDSVTDDVYVVDFVDLTSRNNNEVYVQLTPEHLADLKARKATLNISKGDAGFKISVDNLPVDQDLEFGMKDVTADLTTATAPGTGLGAIYDFSIKKSDGTYVSTFEVPVELNFTIDPALVNNPDHVKVFYFNEDTQEWENIGGTYSNGTVTATTTHFSIYGVFEVAGEEEENEAPVVETPSTEEETETPVSETPSNDQGETTDEESTSTEEEVTNEETTEVEEGRDSTTETETPSTSSDETKGGNALPNTATNSFNLLFVGLVLVVIGGFFFIRNRHAFVKTA